MKKISNKLVSCIIAASAMSSAFTVSAKNYADVIGTGFENTVQVLSALGIMVGDGDGNFRPNDNLTRAEVAKIAIHSMGIEDAASSAANQSKFPDVSKDFWANGYINIATSMGIVIGDDQGNFRPQDPITYAEAMTIMVRATGYEPSAAKKGGFPDGYIMVGSENGISKNVSGTTHNPITRGNVATMTLNTIKTKMMEQKGFGSNPTYEITDKTLMSEKLKVSEHTGQVTAIPTSSLEGASNLSDGQVKINNEVYDTEFNASNLLGYNVTYYVKDDKQNGEHIILMLPTPGKNTEVSFTAELFNNISKKGSNTVISYFKSENDSKTQTAELSSDAKLIYNGKFVPMNTDFLDLTDKSGEMSLLDTNKDGKFDIVFVTDYYNILVNTVSGSGKITDKNSSKTITLDDDVTYTLTRGLEKIKLSDLREYDVLSVAESIDGKLFNIMVSNKKITGKIEGISEDKFTIDGTEYKKSALFNGDLKIGMKATFYLDFENKIAATDTKNITTNASYGYMSKAYMTDTDEVSKFKIFTTENSDKLFEGAAKIKLNGTTHTAEKVISQLKSNGDVSPQLITYILDANGKISEINTATDNTSAGSANEGLFTLDYDMKNTEYNKTTGKLGNVKVTKDTIVFEISDDEDEYSVSDMSIFEDKQKYDVKVFDITENYVAKVIIVSNSTLFASADSSIAIVKEIASGTNKDGEITDILVTLTDGKETKLYAEKEGILVKDGNKELENGDIIQIRKNSRDEISNIRVLFDSDKKEYEISYTPVENLEIVYGKVTKKFNDSMNVSVNGGTAVNYEIPTDAKVYIVDTTLSKNNIKTAEQADIHAYDEEENNRVFIKIYDHVVQEIVIIK